WGRVLRELKTRSTTSQNAHALRRRKILRRLHRARTRRRPRVVPHSRKLTGASHASFRVVKNNAQRVARAAMDAADAVPQIHAVIAARSLHRPVARGEN